MLHNALATTRRLTLTTGFASHSVTGQSLIIVPHILFPYSPLSFANHFTVEALRFGNSLDYNLSLEGFFLKSSKSRNIQPHYR